MEFLTAELDKLDKRRADESAIASWSRGFQDALPVLTEFRQKGELNLDALRSWDVAALQSGKSNQALYDTFSQQAAQFPELIGQTFAAAGGAANLAVATEAAQGAAGRAYGEFIKMGRAAGLTDTESRTLAATLGVLDATQISPKLFEVLAQDEQARAAVAQIQATQIGAKNFEITAGADGAIGTVDDFITYTNASGAAMPPVPVTVTTASAQGVVDKFTGQSITTPDEMINVSANITKADAVVRQFMVAQRQASDIKVGVNMSLANDAVRLFMTAHRQTSDIIVNANTAPARATIAAIENGVYTATVRVIADTSRFFASFNSLPAARGVAVAPAAPAGFAAGFAAPELGGELPLGRSLAAAAAPGGGPLVMRGVGVGAGITINVSGALDPDAVARQIELLLKKHQRRSGTVVL